MGKFVGAIVGAVIVGVGVATSNPALIASGAGMIVTNAVTLLLAPSMPKPDAAQTQKKEERPVRTKGIGTRRVYAKAMHWVTNANGATVDVLAFLSGRSHAMRQAYLNDAKVTISGGVVQQLEDGAYETGKVLAGFNLGLATETAFPAVISALPGIWTEDHRGDGITSGYLIKKPVKSKHYLEIYPQADNTVLSAVFDMAYLFDPRDPTMDAYDPDTWVKADPLLDNPVLGLLWYLITERGVDYDTQILPVIDYWISAADHCDEPVPLKSVQTALADDFDSGASSITVASVNGLATGMTIKIAEQSNSSHTEEKTVTFVSGLTIHFSGSLSYDHSSGSAVTWDSDPENPATERRYRCCILFEMTAEPAQVIGEIIKTFDGWYAQDELGRYIVYSGRYYTPTVTIGPGQIINARHQGFVEDEDFINEITVTYVSADHDYNEPDTTPWTDDADISERGKTINTSFSPQSPSHSQNRRLAKRVMARQNAPDRGTVLTNYEGMSVIGQRFIYLNHVEAGTSFYTGPAEITNSPEKDLQQLGVTFDWVSVDPNIDEWNPATEEGDPAPIGGRVAAAPIAAPTIISAVPQFSTDGSAAQIVIDIDAPDREDLIWYARWRESSAAVYNEQEYSDIAAGSAVTLIAGLVPLNASIKVSVCCKIGDGRISPWTDDETVSTSTAALSPPPPTITAATGVAGSAVIEWANASSANLSYTRAYRNSINSLTGATQVGGDMPSAPGAGQSYTDTATPGTWYYFLRAYNASGTPSSAVGTGAVVVT